MNARDDHGPEHDDDLDDVLGGLDELDERVNNPQQTGAAAPTSDTIQDVAAGESSADKPPQLADEEESDSREKKRSPVLWILGGIAALLVLLIGITAAFSNQRSLNVPVADMGKRGDAINQEQLDRRRRWNEATGKQISELGREVNSMREEAKLLRDRQAKLVTTFRERLDQSLADMRTVMHSTLDSIRSLERKNLVRHRQANLIDAWGPRISAGDVDLKEVYLEIKNEMERLGASQEEIETVYATLMQKAGIIYAANMGEPEMSQQEIMSLPKYMHPLARKMRDSLYAHATTDGEVLKQASVLRMIRTMLKLDANLDKVSDEEVERIWEVCRVRRDDLSEKLQAQLILLVAQQRKEIPDRDPYKIEDMIWAQRSDLGGITPGQHLSLIHVVARLTDNAPNVAEQKIDGTADFKPFTAALEKFAKGVIKQSLKAAYGMHGNNPDKLRSQAELALDNYILGARTKISDAMRSSLIDRGLADFYSTLQNQAQSVQATVVAAPPDTGRDDVLAKIREQIDVVQDDGTRLQIGPVSANKTDARVATWIMAVLIKRVYEGSPLDQKNVPAVVACWEQGHRISDLAFDALAGQASSGLNWGRAIVPQTMEVFDAGQTLLTFGIPLGKDQTDKAHYHLYRGVVFGHEFGRAMHEPQRKDQVVALVKQRYGNFEMTTTLQNVIDAIDIAQPYGRIIEAYTQLGFSRLPVPKDRLVWMLGAADKLLAFGSGIVGSLPKPESWGSSTSGFHESVQEGLRILLPLSMSKHREALGTSQEAYVTLVQQDMLAYLVGLLAQDMTIAELNNSVVPMFVSAVSDNNAGMKRLSAFIRRIVPHRIEELTAKMPSVEEDKVLIAANRVREEVREQVKNDIAIEVVMSRVEPRIEEATQLKGRVFSEEITTQTKTYVAGIVAEPYSVARLDTWAIQATEYAKGLIADGGLLRPMAQTAEVAAVETLIFPQPGMVEKYSGRGMAVGYQNAVSDGSKLRRITIPATSYANAHLISGVDAEIGSDGDAVLMNMNHMLRGPAGSSLYMRNMRFIGEVTPSPGRERITVNLTNLSYVFPSGHQVFVPVKGYVVDEEGIAGISGELDLNLKRILPYAASSGFAGGFAETLRELSRAEVTTVGDGGGIISSGTVDPADNLKNSVLAGVGEGISSIDEHIQGILSEFKPSIRVDIGRSVTIVLTEPVEFDVPVSEFTSLLKEQSVSDL